MMRKAFWFLCHAACLGLIGLLIAGFLQHYHPVFDSFSHFRMIFLVMLAGVSMVFLLAKHWITTGICLFFIFLSIFLTSPYLPCFTPSDDNPTSGQTGSIIRVVQMNLRFDNPTPDMAIDQLKSANADIMLLQEVTLITQPVLVAFKNTHPHQLSCQIKGVGSVAILSKHAFAVGGRKKCARFFGYATAQVTIKGQTVTLASFHSRWPWPYGQKKQVSRLQSDFASLAHPLILAGDFNAAPWSAVVQSIAKQSRTRVAPGLKLTWAPRLLEFKTRIGGLLPIDHILVSPKFDIVSQKILGDGGSDHLPILTTLLLRD